MVDEFKKMEYTEEQCQELEKLSAFGDSMHDIDVHDAEKMLSDAMKKYHLDKDEVDRIIDEANKTKLEKENITMEATGKFKEDLIETLGKAMDVIGEFQTTYESLSHIQKRISKMFEDTNNVDAAMLELKRVSEVNSKILCVNTYDVDLNKLDIDVSKWVEPVKPVKGIISVVFKDCGNFHTEFKIGGLVLLMEDGSFRMS